MQHNHNQEIAIAPKGAIFKRQKFTSPVHDFLAACMAWHSCFHCRLVVKWMTWQIKWRFICSKQGRENLRYLKCKKMFFSFKYIYSILELVKYLGQNIFLIFFLSAFMAKDWGNASFRSDYFYINFDKQKLPITLPMWFHLVRV